MNLNYEILIQSDFSSMKIVRPETNLFSIITIQNNQGKRITIQNCGVDVTEYDVLKLIELNNNNLKNIQP